MKRLARIVAAGAIAAAWVIPAAAQERVIGSKPDEHYRAGWTFTPTFGFGETYDDNISLFGVGTADGVNRDYIASYFPEADLHYSGQHTTFGGSYAGSFLAYRTFAALNRWDQRGSLSVEHQQNARLKWLGNASAAAMPSTDFIDLGGIPFRHVGAQTINGRAAAEYELSARDKVTGAYNVQSVTFDRPDTLRNVLRGGHVQQVLTTYRRKLDERLSVGADYNFRRSLVLGDVAPFVIHEGQISGEYDLSPSWTLSAGGGIVYLLPTPFTEARTGPAYHLGLTRNRGGAVFHVGYLRSYIPSFGFGGTVQNQEVGGSLRMPLFHSRAFYTENSATFRDDQPLTEIEQQLPLRSFRTYSVFGWQPQPWLRVEGFYARVQQTSLRAGGQLYRNRVGFQIVTSHSMRMP